MPPGPNDFLTTRWSVVTRAGHPSDEQRAALGELVELYWYPLYAFLRRRGEREEDARDLVQGFLAELLARDDIARADAEVGRFRSWMIGALLHHASNERRRAAALKRGGDRRFVSLDAEERYAAEPADARTPDALYDRSWALLVIRRALERLEEEYRGRGRGRAFELLKPFLAGGHEVPYERLARELDAAPGAVRVTGHRMRTRLGELLRLEVAQTLADADDVEAELEALFSALRGPS